MLRLICHMFTTPVKSRQFIHESSLSTARKMSIMRLCSDIVWVDLEMTGLDVIADRILEVACIITDKDLNIKSIGPNIVIHHPPEVLSTMNEWCVKHHNESGLVEKVLKSQITPSEGEAMLLKYLKDNIPAGQCPLAGNSVYMDRLFLKQQMPAVDKYLNYRIIDVSTIKELSKRWHPSVYEAAPIKKQTHRSLDDIKESIEELKFYKEHFLNVPSI